MAKRGSSVTSGRAISFAERKTFRAFVLLYTAMALAILTLTAMLYYASLKNRMMVEHRLAMQLEGERYLPELLAWLQGDLRRFPKDPAYETAFFVGEKLLGGMHFELPMQLTSGVHVKGKYIYLIIPMGVHGVDMGKLVMMTEDDGLWLKQYWERVALYGLLLFLLQAAVGLWLSKLFLRPMRSAVKLLDDFIKDTTHELNTPVTAILTNIERLDMEGLDEKQRRKVTRIETAARTIAFIYEDLTYLLLRQDATAEHERIGMDAFLHERLEYFRTRFDAKHLVTDFIKTSDFEVSMDRRSAARLIDNLLSNAAKYSTVGGEVTIRLDEGSVTIANGGTPIPEAKREAIFERYVRADDGQGGFGIGLHLVARIAQTYAIGIDVVSSDTQTSFRLTWPRYTLRSL